MVNALQTFGSYAANFHPHVHALLTDGVFHPDGSFERVWHWDQRALTELFRRMVLAALRREQRLTEEAHLKLLSREHSGFSVQTGTPILPDDAELLEHLARYLCRAPLRMDNVREDAQRVVVRTPPDPMTGAIELKLDPHELIRRLCEQIPAPRQHQVRYRGWYSNRSRGTRRLQSESVERATCGHPQREEGGPAPKGQSVSPSSPPAQAGRDPALDTPAARTRPRSWGRLRRHIYEVDPLLCPRGRVELKIVAVIPNFDVVDRILRHLARKGGDDLLAQEGSRAPPEGRSRVQTEPSRRSCDGRGWRGLPRTRLLRRGKAVTGDFMPCRAARERFTTHSTTHRPASTVPNHAPKRAAGSRMSPRRRPAKARPRWEPRALWPRGIPCALPRVEPCGKPGVELRLVVSHVEGRKHLPVVEVREAA